MLDMPASSSGVCMKKILLTSYLISAFLLSLNACATTSMVVPTAAAIPLQKPTPTIKPTTLTPVESAFAEGNSTANPLEEVTVAHTVTFDTSDGTTITGELYGSGETAVIFSVMGECTPGWREFAHLTAAQGFMALTYQWRGCRANSVDNVLIRKFVEDARAAIAFVRKQGAEKIILAGASLGGCASAKLAVESGASGLIVLASPPSIPQWGFEIQSADLNTEIPKLFITAEHDDTVPAEATRALYDLAAEPKDWQTYPGSAHGTNLFDTENKSDLQLRILEFIHKIVSEQK
jgi:esterase/lipase